MKAPPMTRKSQEVEGGDNGCSQQQGFNIDLGYHEITYHSHYPKHMYNGAYVLQTYIANMVGCTRPRPTQTNMERRIQWDQDKETRCLVEIEYRNDLSGKETIKKHG